MNSLSDTFPTDKASFQVDRELTRLLVESSVKANTFVIVGSLLLVIVLKSAMPVIPLLFWFGFMSMISASRIILSAMYARDHITDMQCIRLYTGATALLGLGWAALPLLPGAFDTTFTLGVIYMVGAGVIILGNNLLYMQATAMLLYVVPMPLVISWQLLSTSQERAFELVALMLTFLGFILWMGWQNNRSLRNNLTLQFINELLIERLQHANREANAASEAKSNFLANMSHEIRTPLNAILGLSRMLRSTALNRQQHHLMNTLYSSSENLLGLLNNILDMSKIEAGQLSIEHRPFRLQDVLDEIRQVMQGLAADRQIELVVAPVGGDLPEFVTGDRLRLRQILLNLVSNAIKFTEQGSVTLTVRADTSTHEEGLQFSVADTGIGIPPEQQRIIFENFSQGDESVARRFGGTGLGLTICRQLVELMEGEIRFDSTPDSGTTFHVLLSLPAAPAHAAVHGQSSTESFPANLQVLLVEDNEINRMITAFLLESEGHSVDEAANGMLALEMIAEHQYDVILMDVQMPVMDGLTACTALRSTQHGGSAGELLAGELGDRLRRNVEGRDIPVIALTAHAMATDRERCLKAGMNDYITKPVTREDLLRAFSRLRTGETAPADRKSGY